jgi:hypothetical protein
MYYDYRGCFIIKCFWAAALNERVEAAAKEEDGKDREAALAADSEEGEGALVAEGTNKDRASLSSSSGRKGDTIEGATTEAGALTEANWWSLRDCSLSGRETTTEGCCGLAVTGREACGGCGFEVRECGACNG